LFFDDAVLPGPLASGLGVVVGGIDAVRERRWENASLVMGVGLPATKASVAARVADTGLAWATVVHPRATVGPNAVLGEGAYVAGGAIVTVNVRAGRFATINMHCQVAHDDVLGDFVTLHPDAHLAGCVTIGDGCEIGAGVVVTPGLTIGQGARIGA